MTHDSQIVPLSTIDPLHDLGSGPCLSQCAVPVRPAVCRIETDIATLNQLPEDARDRVTFSAKRSSPGTAVVMVHFPDGDSDEALRLYPDDNPSEAAPRTPPLCSCFPPGKAVAVCAPITRAAPARVLLRAGPSPCAGRMLRPMATVRLFVDTLGATR